MSSLRSSGYFCLENQTSPPSSCQLGLFGEAESQEVEGYSLQQGPGRSQVPMHAPPSSRTHSQAPAQCLPRDSASPSVSRACPLGRGVTDNLQSAPQIQVPFPRQQPVPGLVGHSQPGTRPSCSWNHQCREGGGSGYELSAIYMPGTSFVLFTPTLQGGEDSPIYFF